MNRFATQRLQQLAGTLGALASAFLATGLTIATLSQEAAAQTAAQDFPSKQIRWIVPYPPGGGGDIVARLVSHKMSGTTAQSILVENRPGGNTVIGTQALLSSKADGYTVMHTAEQIAANGTLYKNLKYSAEKDIDFIGTVVKTPLVLLAKFDLPVSNAQEVIAYLKANDRKVTYGSWGQGGMNHLTMEAFAARLNVTPVHVPFAGAAPAIKDLLGGEIDLYFSDLASALPHVRAGKLKPMLVSTRERVPMLPNIPTLQELGFEGFDMYSYQGVVAPKGMPPEVLNKLSELLRNAVNNPEVRADLSSRGFIPAPSTSAEFRAQFLESQTQLGNIIRQRNIVIE
jgi:tripartite-type tricarboxylate transporter receptor subunit TctC